MSERHVITVPKETVNDDTYLVAALHCAEAAWIEPGQPLASLETSKAIVDVTAPAAGYVFFNALEGQRIPVGATLALVTPASATRPADFPPGGTSSPPGAAASAPTGPAASGTNFSQAAAQLIAQHGVDPAVFAGRSLVKASDVEAHLRTRAAPGARPELLPDLPALHDRHVVICGGGGHGKVCIEILRAAGALEILGVTDPAKPLGARVLDVPVIGRDTALPELQRRGLRLAVLGLGGVTAHAQRRQLLTRLQEQGFALPNLVHPRAALDPSARLGQGNQLFAHSTVGADARLGDGCIINAGAVVSHDCALGHNVHLAPGALLAGGVTVGDDTLVGMGAMIYLGVAIGRRVRINNGAVVNADVPDDAVVNR